MASTITIIFLTLLTFGKMQEINDIPLKAFQKYRSNFPGVQSIKGRYIEERKKETKSVPLYDYQNSDVSNSKSNKQATNLSDIKNSSSIPKNNSSMKFNKSIVNVESVMNSTLESLKKEIFFDSLLIENNWNVESEDDHDVSDLIEAHFENGTIQKENDIPKPHTTFDEFDLENAEENNITRRILPNVLYQPLAPGIMNIPLDYNLLQNKAQVNMARKNYPKSSPGFHEAKKPSCEKDELRTVPDETEEEKDIKNRLSNPAKGSGITDVVKTRMMMLKHPRVCYACSSIHDMSCWSPDRKTSVKYCREDHHSCVSKLYKYKGLSYVIRDCGSSCSATASSSSSGAGAELAFSICTMCHSDLCNRAHYLEAQRPMNIFLSPTKTPYNECLGSVCIQIRRRQGNRIRRVTQYFLFLLRRR